MKLQELSNGRLAMMSIFVTFLLVPWVGSGLAMGQNQFLIGREKLSDVQVVR